MKSLIRKILFGDTTISEYSNIRIAGEIQEKVYLETDNRILDISQNHWLLCIEPVIFGIWSKENEEKVTYKEERKYHMYFCDSFNNNDNIKKNAVAELTIIFFDYVKEEQGTLFLFKLKKSNIYHLNFIKRDLLFARYYKKNGLTFSKFKSFVSAYSYPRRIRLVSFRQGDYYNIFPMDLLGDIKHNNRYVFGLRHTNVSLPKIIETGKLVVSEVSFKHKNTIYELGKHHSSKPPAFDSLPFNLMRSKNFGFYIPDWVESYKEIKVLKTKNLGSHMLLWGEVLEEINLKDSTDHLFLIHFFQYLHQKNKGVNYPLA